MVTDYPNVSRRSRLLCVYALFGHQTHINTHTLSLMPPAFCLSVCQMGGEGGGRGGGDEGKGGSHYRRWMRERLDEYGPRLRGHSDTGEMWLRSACAHTHAHTRFYLSHTQWLQVSTSRSKNLVQNSVTNFGVCLQNLHSCMQSNTHISFHKITSQFRATLEICRTVHTLHSSVYLADIFLVCVKWSFS